MDPEIVNSGVPILGICYGHQLLADMAGGRVSPTGPPSTAAPRSMSSPAMALLGDLPPRLEVWMSHRRLRDRAAPGFCRHRHVSRGLPWRRWRIRERGLYGVQFHPEVSHTAPGPGHPEDDSSTTSAGWHLLDQPLDHRSSRSTGSAPRSATARWSADSPVGSIRRLPRLWSIEPWATSSRAYSSTTVCCGQGEAEQVDETFRRHFQTNLIQVKAGRPVPGKA